MKFTPDRVMRVYITLTLLSTFAASFIWGVNTLFLLDAGLSITQAFAANAFFTLGQVIFEVPTGVFADAIGRRFSYLLGTVTLFVTTILYLLLWNVQGPFWAWAFVSMFLGLGFTFFSGATEAWLVDALKDTGYKKPLDTAFARGQVAQGVAMLSGSILGGVIAQFTNLGVPYILRSTVLLFTFIVAFSTMYDLGFKRQKKIEYYKTMKNIVRQSLDKGLRVPAVRWVMLSGPFLFGVLFYAFYAMQPYLLELWGENSYAVAGLAAAIVAGSQIVGGLLTPKIRQLFKRRTTALMLTTFGGGVTLVVIGLVSNFWVVLILLAIWGILFAASLPIRQAYFNGLIPSAQRATVLSTDNLLGSAGAVFTQPTLGKSADVWGYGVSYVISGVIQLFALPFLLLAKKQNAKSDFIVEPKSEI